MSISKRQFALNIRKYNDDKNTVGIGRPKPTIKKISKFGYSMSSQQTDDKPNFGRGLA